jgi:hypothetical protein
MPFVAAAREVNGQTLAGAAPATASPAISDLDIGVGVDRARENRLREGFQTANSSTGAS